MTEVERRVILEVIDELQELDDIIADQDLGESVIRLMDLLRVVPDLQEYGE